MKPRDDDFGDMNDAPLVAPTSLGRGTPDAEVTQFLIRLRDLGECAAPEPGPEVAALLGGARLLRRRTGRALARIAVATTLAVTAIVGTAAAHDLPAPAQGVVSNVVNVLTPFHIAPQRSSVQTPTRRPSGEHPDNNSKPGGATDRESSSPSEPGDGSSGSSERGSEQRIRTDSAGELGGDEGSS